MKRTLWKKKIGKPSKKCKLKHQSKQKISVLQRKLWVLCREIIRKKYGNTCYTCGRTGLSGANWHTGHLWAKASLGAYLKYDLRVLRPQCYNCNINQGGRGADFYRNLVGEIGQEAMDKLQKDRRVSVKAYDHYQKLLLDYEKIYGEKIVQDLAISLNTSSRTLHYAIQVYKKYHKLSCKAQDMLDFIRDLRSKDRDTLIERIDNELPYYLRSITTKDGTKDVKVFIKEDVKQIILKTLK